jgi:predicted SnoaL-like aldol condensation-catalyzing enzyme
VKAARHEGVAAIAFERNQDMSAQTHQVISRYFDEVWNQGRLEVLDEIMAPDYLNHSPSTPNPRPGPQDLKPIVRAMRDGIPDLHYQILDMVVAPDKVAVHVRVTGTHRGTLFGIAPTGRRIDVRQMQFEWIRRGRIWQHWRVTDELTLMRQLGVVP